MKLTKQQKQEAKKQYKRVRRMMKPKVVKVETEAQQVKKEGRY